jgi:hypothetical protein
MEFELIGILPTPPAHARLDLKTGYASATNGI